MLSNLLMNITVLIILPQIGLLFCFNGRTNLRKRPMRQRDTSAPKRKTESESDFSPRNLVVPRKVIEVRNTATKARSAVTAEPTRLIPPFFSSLSSHALGDTSVAHFSRAASVVLKQREVAALDRRGECTASLRSPRSLTERTERCLPRGKGRRETPVEEAI